MPRLSTSHAQLSRRRSFFTFAAVGLAAASGACSGGHSTARVVDTTSSTVSRSTLAPSSSTSSSSTTTTTAPPVRGPVTLAFGGDVHFEGALRAKLAAGPEHVLDAIAPTLRAADLAMVNLETAITERGSAQPKEFTFRAPPSAFQALRAAGIDVATMANNHGLDFGPVGLADSLAAIQQTGFPVVGIGADAAHAYAPYRVTVHGQRIAILGATQVIDGALIPTWTATATHSGVASAKNVDVLVAAVRAARLVSDTVVVYLHWGIEGSTCPSSAQRSLAQALVVAGADVVVGSHAHRLLGAGRLGPAFVDYGLGNFAFYSRGGSAAQTGVLTVTVTGRKVDGYAWSPAVISGGTPVPLTSTDATAARNAWTSRRGCTDLTP